MILWVCVGCFIFALGAASGVLFLFWLEMEGAMEMPYAGMPHTQGYGKREGENPDDWTADRIKDRALTMEELMPYGRVIEE